jgi:hypothetical protein
MDKDAASELDKLKKRVQDLENARMFGPLIAELATAVYEEIAKIGVTIHTGKVLTSVSAILAYANNPLVDASYRSAAKNNFIANAAQLTGLSPDGVKPHFDRIKEYKDVRNSEQHPVMLSKESLRKALQQSFADTDDKLQSFLLFLNILPIDEAEVERLL